MHCGRARYQSVAMDKHGRAGTRPIGNCEPQLDDTHGPAVDTRTATMGGGKAFARSALIAGSRYKNSHDGRGHII